MFGTHIQSQLYKHVLKPIAFRLDPEDVHDYATKIGYLLGKNPFTKSIAKHLWSYSHPALAQEILGIHFPNPVGLAAGFDKDAYLTEILPDVGFGFEEIGSVTGEACEGNPKPRLWRLPKSQSLIVHYGLKNEGTFAISKRLQSKTFRVPLGISIAKTNSPKTSETQNGINDYLKAMRAFVNIGDYITINISCPNAFGGEPFTSPERLDNLLTHIDQIETKQPIFLKMPADLSTHELDQLVAVASRHRVQGLIVTNLTKRRDHKELDQDEVTSLSESKGGLSGKPVFETSNASIKHLYQTVGDRFVIIGTGGIFSAEDAYTKIRSGATLVQLITGMIFEGPQLIGEINRGLVEFMHRDGFKHINEIIGIDSK